jgi:drug/metabolite transporter (DMT)-like permease
MCPASALFAYLLLKAKFSWSQIGAIVFIIKGIFLGCVIELLQEREEGKITITAWSMVLLCASSFL